MMDKKIALSTLQEGKINDKSALAIIALIVYAASLYISADKEPASSPD